MKWLNSFSKLYLKIVTGLIVGLLISAVVSLNVWLDMRVHSYHTVIISTLIVAAILLVLKTKPERLFFKMEIIAILFAAIAGKFTRFQYDMREVLGWQTKIQTTTAVLLCIILLANAIALFRIKKDVK